MVKLFERGPDNEKIVQDVPTRPEMMQAIVEGGSEGVNWIEGPFVAATRNTGWWGGWSPLVTAKTSRKIIVDWKSLGTVQAPDIDTDMKIDVDMGSHYLRGRRCRIYSWVDWRVLVNGRAVQNNYWEVYRYLDTLQSTSPNIIPPVPVNIEPWGSVTNVVHKIPAKATIDVQVRMHWQIPYVQSHAWARHIGGLRSNYSAVFMPRKIAG